MKKNRLNFVSNERMHGIVDQYGNKEYASEDLIDCYTIDEKTNKYVYCLNKDGDCWVDEYDEYSTMIVDIFKTLDHRCNMFDMIDDSIYKLKWACGQDDLALRHEYARGVITAYYQINLLNRKEYDALLKRVVNTYKIELHKIVDEKDGE